MEYGIMTKIRNIVLVLIALFIVGFAFSYYFTENKNVVPYNEIPKGNVLVVKHSYLYPYKTTIAIYKNGTIMRSKIVNKPTDLSDPKEKYNTIKELTKEELTELDHLIRACEKHRNSEIVEVTEETDTTGVMNDLLIKTSAQASLELSNKFEAYFVKELETFIDKVTNVE